MPEPRVMGQPFKAMLLPAKYVQRLERTQELNLCCRHVEEENHTAQWFATYQAAREKIKKTITHEGREYEVTEEGEQIPDLLIITCGKCGRKHRRWFLGGGDQRPIFEKR